MPSRLPTLSSPRKPAGDFDELLYHLSTSPNAPVTHKFHDTLESPIDTLNLSWRSPSDTGGLPITHYLIEQLPYDQQGFHSSWIPVMTVPADQTSAQILPDTMKPYTKSSFYRVRAVNAVGPGMPLETLEPIIVPTHGRTSTVDKELINRLPEAPQGPLRAEIRPDHLVDLSWKAPRRLQDISPRRTGSFETPSYPQKYIIEATLADDFAAPWLEVGNVPGSATTARVQIPSVSLFHPCRGHESPIPRSLLYRVRAGNEYGYSAPLTVRLKTDSKSQIPLSKLPVLPSGPVRVRLMEPLEKYEISVPPSLELKWTPFIPPALKPGFSEHIYPSDFNYQVEYRLADDLGWRHLATLPLGHERFTFYAPAPSSSDLELPKSVAYQFRVGVRGPLGVGEFRDSNIVSWKYAAHIHSTISPKFEPIPVARAPLNLELVRAWVDAPENSYMIPTGSIILRWRMPSFGTGAMQMSYIVERWLPETGAWRTLSHKLDDRGQGIYEATVPALPINKPHFIRVSAVGHLGSSESTMLPYPIWIPVSFSTTPGISCSLIHGILFITGSCQSIYLFQIHQNI